MNEEVQGGGKSLIHSVMKTLFVLGMLSPGVYVARAGAAAMATSGFETGDFRGWTTNTYTVGCGEQG